jgi:hypothetical protein
MPTLSPLWTVEQRAARAALRALAPGWRLTRDEEGWPTLPGRAGRVEWYDPETLAVYTPRPRLFPKLWAIPGVRRWQTGDLEMRALFPLEALDQVARVVRLRRRRHLTPEAARTRSGLPTVRATSAA